MRFRVKVFIVMQMVTPTPANGGKGDGMDLEFLPTTMEPNTKACLIMTPKKVLGSTPPPTETYIMGNSREMSDTGRAQGLLRQQMGRFTLEVSLMIARSILKFLCRISQWKNYWERYLPLDEWQ